MNKKRKLIINLIFAFLFVLTGLANTQNVYADTCEHEWKANICEFEEVDNYHMADGRNTAPLTFVNDDKTHYGYSGIPYNNPSVRLKITVPTERTFTVHVTANADSVPATAYADAYVYSDTFQQLQHKYVSLSYRDLTKDIEITLPAGTSYINLDTSSSSSTWRYYQVIFSDFEGIFLYDECSICHEQQDHTLGEEEIVNPATCTTAGKGKKVCSSCGYESEYIIPATGHHAKGSPMYEYAYHTYISYPENAAEVTPPAQCGDYYEYTFKCDDCDYSETTNYYQDDEDSYQYGKRDRYSHEYEEDTDPNSPNNIRLANLDSELNTTNGMSELTFENEEAKLGAKASFLTGKLRNFMVKSDGSIVNNYVTLNRYSYDYSFGITLNKAYFKVGTTGNDEKYLKYRYEGTYNDETVCFEAFYFADDIVIVNIISLPENSDFDNYIHTYSYTGRPYYASSVSIEEGKKLICKYSESVQYGISISFSEEKYKIYNNTPVTCTSSGSYSYKCKYCDYYSTSYISSTGHNFAEDITIEPTCTDYGYTTRKCVNPNCEETAYSEKYESSEEYLRYYQGYYDYSDEEIKPIVHAYILSRYPTCLTNSVDPVGHDWESLEKTESTCTEKGYEKRKCKVCKLEEEGELDLAPHTYTSETISETTYEKGGQTKYTCEVCGYNYIEESTAKNFIIRAEKLQHYPMPYYDVDFVKFSENSSNQYATAAIDKDGNIWTWGDCSELGITSSKPMQMTQGLKFTSVTLTNMNIGYAIDEHGCIWCWGQKSSYNPGTYIAKDDSSSYQTFVFERYNSDTKFKKVVSNNSDPYVAILSEAGDIYISGSVYTGAQQIVKKDDISNSYYYMEKVETGDTKFDDIRLVYGGLVAMSKDGDFWSGGDDNYTTNYGSTDGTTDFVNREIGFKIKGLATSCYTTYVIDENGDLWGCGSNNYNLLGREGNGQASFEKILAGKKIKKVDSNYYLTGALTESGELYMVGYGDWFYIPGQQSYYANTFTNVTPYLTNVTNKVTDVTATYVGLYLTDTVHNAHSISDYSWYAIPDGSKNYNYTKAYNQITTVSHTFNVADEKAPTCTEEGYKDMACECGVSYRETIKANGHAYHMDEDTFNRDLDNKVISYTVKCDNCDSEKNVVTAEGNIYGNEKTIYRSCDTNDFIFDKKPLTEGLLASVNDETLYTQEEVEAFEYPVKIERYNEVFTTFSLFQDNENVVKSGGVGVDKNGDLWVHGTSEGHEQYGYYSPTSDSTKYFKHHIDGVYFTEVLPYDGNNFVAKDIDGNWFIKTSNNATNYQLIPFDKLPNYDVLTTYVNEADETIDLTQLKIKSISFANPTLIGILYENGMAICADIQYVGALSKYGITSYSVCPEKVVAIEGNFFVTESGEYYYCRSTTPGRSIGFDVATLKYYDYNKGSAYSTQADVDFVSKRHSMSFVQQDGKIYAVGDALALKHYANPLAVTNDGILIDDVNTFIAIDTDGFVDSNGLKYTIRDISGYIDIIRGDTSVSFKTVRNGNKYPFEIQPTTHANLKQAVVKEPTCSENGEVRVVCEDCGLDVISYLPKTKHVFSDVTIEKSQSTATATMTCEVCGKQKASENVEYTNFLPNGAATLGDTSLSHPNIVLDCGGNMYAFAGNVQTGTFITSESTPQLIETSTKFKSGCIGDVFYGIDFEGNIWTAGSAELLDLDKSEAEREVLHQITEGVVFKKVASNVGNTTALALDENNNLYILNKYTYYQFVPYTLSNVTASEKIVDIAVVNDTCYVALNNNKVYAFKQYMIQTKSYNSTDAIEKLDVVALPNRAGKEFNVYNGKLTYTTGTTTKKEIAFSEIVNAKVTQTALYTYNNEYTSDHMLTMGSSTNNAMICLKDNHIYANASNYATLMSAFPEDNEVVSEDWLLLAPDKEFSNIYTAGGIFFAINTNGDVCSFGNKEYTSMAGRNILDDVVNLATIQNIHGENAEVVEVVDYTCTEDGYTTYHCNVCGDTFVSDITKAQHRWELVEQTEEASFGHFGKGQYKCSVCDETKEDSTEELDTIDPSEWEYVTDDSTNMITLTRYRGNKKNISINSYYYVLAKDKWYHTQMGVSTTENGPFVGSEVEIREVTFGEDVTVENNDASLMFYEMNIYKINGFPKGITSSNEMFLYSTIQNLDLSHGELTEVTNTSNMFWGAKFDTVKVAYSGKAVNFEGLTHAAEGNAFELSIAENTNTLKTSRMFTNGKIKYVSADLSKTKLDRLTSMFSDSSGLEGVTLKCPDTVIGMSYTFENCTALLSENVDIDFPDTLLISMESCFEGCTSLTTKIENIPLCRNYRYIFKNCSSMIELSDLHDTYEDHANVIAINYESAYEGCGFTDIDYKFCMLKNGEANYKNMFKNCFPEHIKIGYQKPPTKGYSFPDIADAFSYCFYSPQYHYRDEGWYFGLESEDGYSINEVYPTDVEFYCSMPAQEVIMFQNYEVANIKYSEYINKDKEYPNHPVYLNTKDEEDWLKYEPYIDGHNYVGGICTECGSYEEDNTDINDFVYTIKGQNVVLSKYTGLDTTLSIPDTYEISGQTYNTQISSNFDYGYFVTDLNFGNHVALYGTGSGTLYFNLENTLVRLNRIPLPTTKQVMEVTRGNLAFNSQDLILPDNVQTVRVAYRKIATLTYKLDEENGTAYYMPAIKNSTTYVTQTHGIHFMYGCGNPYVKTSGKADKPFSVGDGLLNNVNITNAKYTLEKTHIDFDGDNFCDGCFNYLSSEDFPFEFSVSEDEDGNKIGTLISYLGDKYDNVDTSEIVIPASITLNDEEYKICVDTSVYLFMDRELDTVIFEDGVLWDYTTSTVTFNGYEEAPIKYGSESLEKVYESHDRHNNIFYHSHGLKKLSIGSSNMTNLNGFFAPGIGYSTDQTVFTSLDAGEYENLVELTLPSNADSIVDLFTSRGTYKKQVNGYLYNCFATSRIGLTELTLPDSITDAYGALLHESSIEKVNIPQNVTDLRSTYAYTCVDEFTSDLPLSATLLDWTFAGAETTDYSFLHTMGQNLNITSLTATFAHSSITETVPLPPNVQSIAMMYYQSDLQGDVVFIGEHLSDVRLSVANTAITSYKLVINGSQTVQFTPKEDPNRAANANISTANAGMFMGCSRLKAVDIKMKNIENGVLGFMENTKIEKFYFDIQNLTSLNYTFEEWKYLKEVSDIPYGVVSMIGTFKDSALTNFPAIPETVTDMTRCFQGTSITEIPEGCFSTGVLNLSNAFRDCRYLTEVKSLPSSVTNMDQSFENCPKLTTVCDIPESVTSMIGTFYKCGKLATVGTLPSEMTELVDTFLECKDLKTVGHTEGVVTLPDSIKTIARAFKDSGVETLAKWPTSIQTLNGFGRVITYENYVASYNREKGKVYYGGELTAAAKCYREELINKTAAYNDAVKYNYANKNTLAEEVKKLSAYEALCPEHTVAMGGFQGSLITSIPDIPESLTCMNYAFIGCNELIEAPAMHENIEEAVMAFRDCPNLTTAKKIAGKDISYAFDRCPKLSTIEDYDLSTTTNMNYTFNQCSALTSAIPIPAGVKGNAEYTYANSGITALPEIESGVTKLPNTFTNCKSLGDESDKTIPKSVNVFDNTFNGSSITKAPVSYGGKYDETFINCKDLVDASKAMQGNVSSVLKTFTGCTALENAPATIVFTGTDIDGLYYGCENLVHGSTIKSTSLKTADRIYKDCTKLEDANFEGCNALTSLNETFYNCENLKEVQLNNLTNLTTMYGTFYNCSSLEQAPSLANCSHLESLASTFYNCSSLQEVPVLPSGLKYLSNGYMYTAMTHVIENHKTGTSCNCSSKVENKGAFENCISLTELADLPNSILLMPSAFKNCSNLSEISSLPSNVTDISSAFMNCTSLKAAVDFPTSITNAVNSFCNTGIEEVTISPNVTAQMLSNAFVNCEKLGKITFNNGSTATLELKEIFGLNNSLAERLFNDNIQGYKLTTVINQNNPSANASVLSPAKWMSSHRMIAGAFSTNLNKDATILYNEGSDVDIEFRLKGQDLNPVWFRANTTELLDDVQVVYTASDLQNKQEATISFASNKFNEYVANKGTNTASYVILFDVEFNDVEGDTYALLNNANANSVVPIYDTSTAAFNHIFQDEDGFGSLEIAKQSNMDVENATNITVAEMKNAVTFSNFRLCEININDSSKVIRPRNISYEEYTNSQSGHNFLSGLMSALGIEPQADTSDITDMMSILTLTDLTKEDDGSVYVCYLEAYNSGVRSLLQPVTLDLNKIESLTAEYKGEPIWISDTSEYDKDDVDVMATYTDGSEVKINSSAWTESSLIVDEKGMNTYTATVGDKSAEFKVPGIVYASLDAEYVGKPIQITKEYDKDDVDVILYEYCADDTPYVSDDGKQLNSDEWTESSLLVEKEDNLYTATYTDEYVFSYDYSFTYNEEKKEMEITGTGDIVMGSTKGYYAVPGYKHIKEMKAKYVGDPIWVTDNYSKDDVVVTLIYDDDSTKEITKYFWKESGLSVKNKGSNEYTATYHDANTDTDYTAPYMVPGVVKATISATYTGAPIRVGYEYDKEEVEVILNQTRADGTNYCNDITLSANDWTESGLLVQVEGENDYVATYTDAFILNGTATDGYEVPGYYKVISLTAEYKGEPILIIDEYNKEEVEVIATFENNTQRTLDKDEWVESSLVVNEKGANAYTASYTDVGNNTVSAPYEVKGLVKAHISAEYKGEPVVINNNYNKAEVEVILTQTKADDSNYCDDITLTVNDWTESSLLVQVEGDNNYVATYTDEFIVGGAAVDGYTVPGILQCTGLVAEYKGDPIFIIDEYDKEKVEVVASFIDGSQRTLDKDEWTESSLIVNTKGINNYTASFGGQTAPYEVKGVVKGVLNVKYNGPEIEVNHNYDKNDVEVKLSQFKADDSPYIPDITLSANDWTESSLLVTVEGDNNYTATYNDEYIIDGVATGEYVVPGFIPDPDLVSISAEYTGEAIKIGNEYNKEDVEVIAYYIDGSQRTLTKKEWTESSLIVTVIGDNQYVATYKGLTDDYTVPGVDYIKSIKAIYNGPDIPITQEYDKDDVDVYLVYASGTETLLTSDEWTESSLVVEKEGANNYTATYEDYKPAPYVVNGIDDVVGLSAVYTGPDIYIGKTYNKDDVVVKALKRSGKEVTLKSNEWSADSLIVAALGDNQYVASYKGLTDDYTVIGYKEAYIKADYKGDDILVGNLYDKKDVDVLLYYTNSTYKKLTTSQWTESSLLVEKAGANSYIATYQNMTDDYSVNGKDMVVKLSAKYNGPDILIGNPYDKNDVTVIATYSSGKEVTLKSNEWTESSLLVTLKGTNNYTAKYAGLSAGYKVNGVDYIKSMSAKYNGPDILVGKNYNKDNVTVTITYASGTKDKLNSSQWTESGLKVEQIDKNTYTATYESMKADYFVNGYDVKGLSAEYTGEPIKIDHEYDKEDVLVKLIYTNDTEKVIDVDDWTESGLIVKKVGDNTYTATYKDYTDDYVVKGYDEEPVEIKSLVGTYPEDVLVNDEYDPDKTIITVTYTDGSKQRISYKHLTKVPDSRIVTRVGDNLYDIEYKGVKGILTVPGYDIEGIEAKYVGPDIPVSEEYEKPDVIVTIIYTNGKRVETTEFDVNSLLVTKVGANTYTATYKGYNADYVVNGVDKQVVIPASTPTATVDYVKTADTTMMKIIMLFITILGAIATAAVYTRKKL